MEYVDYYKVLEVSRDASQEEINKAYKRMARKYHPDLNKSANAEDRFKEINEAHEVLSDPDKRKRYDTLGANWKHGANFEPPPEWGGPGGFNVHFGSGGAGAFSDFFESMFGGSGRRKGGAPFSFDDLFGSGGQTNFNTGGYSAPQRGEDVDGELEITLEEAYHGTVRTLQLGGSNGSRRLEVKVPQGVTHGSRIRLTGQGNQGRGGGPAGDVYLKINIQEHSQFELKGVDVYTTLPITPWDAALGTQATVNTLDGAVTLKIPAGSSSGRKMRLKGKGLPDRNKSHGDLYAEIQIVVPKKLSKQERKLFEQLRESSNFKTD